MKIKDSLTPFGIQALELDNCFSELQRLGEQIGDLGIDSDSDFRLAVKLLTKFSENALGLERTVGEFSRELDLARETSDKTVKAVAAKAALIQQRKVDQQKVEQQLTELGNKVRQVIPILANSKNSEEASNDCNLADELILIDSKLVEFIEEARLIKDWAQEHKFRDASRSAESLQATLQTAKTKLVHAISTIH